MKAGDEAGLLFLVRASSHRHWLGWFHSLGRRGDHRGVRRKDLYWAVMRSDRDFLSALGAEMMAVVTHFHAKWEEC